MKDSGIEWLGKMPCHWDLTRLKYVSPHVTVGIVITPAKYYADRGVACLRSLNLRPHSILDTDLVFISEESNRDLSKSIIYQGDLVAVRTGQPGTTAVVDERFDGANCIDLIIIRNGTRALPDYLCFFMNSDAAHQQYKAGSAGAIQLHFNIETASNLLLPLPPLDEQRSIAAALHGELQREQKLAACLQSQVSKLREYRQALITAAVTGKIDAGAAEAA